MNLSEQKAFDTYHTYKEIITQAASWQAVLRDLQSRQAELVNFWQKTASEEVLFTGCGSTYYLSLSAAHTFQSTTGLLARAYPASELLLFPQTAISGARRSHAATPASCGMGRGVGSTGDLGTGARDRGFGAGLAGLGPERRDNGRAAPASPGSCGTRNGVGSAGFTSAISR